MKAWLVLEVSSTKREEPALHQSLIKKWHKKSYFAILDFLVLNSFHAWNMCAEEVQERLSEKY